MAINKKLLEDLQKRKQKALIGGGQDKIDARHAKGLLTARERISTLVEPGTFLEMGMHANHDCHGFGLDGKEFVSDGVVCGTGYVGNRPVAIAAHDFTVGGGSCGRIHARKICNVMDHAVKAGMPIVTMNDSGGARIQEGVSALSGYGQIFSHNVYASGVVPQIALICGPCAGGAAYSPALMDFLIMTKDAATMFICGPDVIKAATGQECTMQEVGSASAHAQFAGNIHFVADDDNHAIEILKKLLSFLPSNNLSDPPHDLSRPMSLAPNPTFNEIIPEDAKSPLDVRKVLNELVDNGDYLEVMREFAPNILICFARIEGVVVGIVANQPMVKAGCLDINSADKAARFVRFCNSFNIPLVTLVDVPGFLPGVQQERGGIIRHGAKMLFAYASATVPKVTLIMRKAYGGAYMAMCSKDMGADSVLAWPTAEIAVMGAQGAVRVLFRKEIKEASDPAAKAQDLIEQYHDKFASPYEAANRAQITDVINPQDTRSMIALTLRNLLSKRETRPAKKHGNIPL